MYPNTPWQQINAAYLRPYWINTKPQVRLSVNKWLILHNPTYLMGISNQWFKIYRAILNSILSFSNINHHPIIPYLIWMKSEKSSEPHFPSIFNQKIYIVNISIKTITWLHFSIIFHSATLNGPWPSRRMTRKSATLMGGFKKGDKPLNPGGSGLTAW